MTVETVTATYMNACVSQNNFKGLIMQKTELPEQLEGDQLRLKQILINLIKNALKFTIGGTVRILVAFDEKDESIKVAIVDNGKGIR